MAAYVFLTMYGLFFLWLIWAFHRETKGQQISAVRSFPGRETDGNASSPSEGGTSEDLQGQRG